MTKLESPQMQMAILAAILVILHRTKPIFKVGPVNVKANKYERISSDKACHFPK